MSQASERPVPGIIAWPLVLVHAPAALIVVFGSGDGPYRRAAAVVTVAVGIFLVAYRSHEIARGRLPFTYVPAATPPAATEFTDAESLAVLMAAAAIGLPVLWPALEGILMVVTLPLMAGCCYRFYRWLDQR